MYMEMELGLVWHTGHSDQSAGESNHVWWGRSDLGLVCGRCATKGARSLDGRTFAAAGCVGHVCLSHFVFRVGPTRPTWYPHGSIDCPGAHPSAPPPPRAGAGTAVGAVPARATFSRSAPTCGVPSGILRARDQVSGYSRYEIKKPTLQLSRNQCDVSGDRACGPRYFRVGCRVS